MRSAIRSESRNLGGDLDGYERREQVLYCEDVPLTAIAEQTGTPVYVYSRQMLLDRFERLDRAFQEVDHLICYSVKANSNLAVLALLGRAGAGADVVSGGELYRALRAGIPAGKIVFSGVGKSEAEISEALRQRIFLLNCESAPELDAIETVAARLGVRAPVALRLNPGVDPDTHHYIATGRSDSKFGLSAGEVQPLYRRIARSPHLEAAGIDMHIGSQIVTAAPYVRSVEILRELVLALRRDGVELRAIDLGGGLGIVYDREETMPATEFAAAVLPLLGDLGLTVVLEPGRYIAGNAGVLLTRVLYLKESGSKTFVILDAGMNDLIRPTLYDAHHRIEPVVTRGRPEILADWVGPVCETGDFLARDRRGERPQSGELVAVRGAGAYGATMASNYNARPRAPEVLVEGSQFRVVRRRESFDDLVRLEEL
jgi:diaminopimelate decarboxylase